MILNGLPWKQTDHSVVFEIASKYCISDSFVATQGAVAERAQKGLEELSHVESI